MTTNDIPVSVNYTNRDFYSLRDDLITRIQTRVNAGGGNSWSATDPSDFGVALVEAFAYIGDITNYYIDRAANEGFLATAVKRQSLLDLATLFGYSPSGWRQASVSIQITNSNTSPVFIPSGTQISTTSVNGSSTTTLYYTITDDVYVPGNSGQATVTALHGQDVSTLSTNSVLDITVPNDITGELLGASSGLPLQSYSLLNTPVADGSVSVYVYDGNYYVAWQEVDHLSDYGSTDTVYTLTTDANNVVTITFGDGINGSIPTYGMKIKATYLIGGGYVGNISAGNLFSVVYVPASSGVTLSSLQGGISLINPSSASGGSDPESNDSIRVNAPSALKTLWRAVSINDYAQLALNTPVLSGSSIPVGKAYAKSTQPNSVVLYVAPYTDASSSDYYPGFNSTNTTPTATWYTLQSSVASYLSDKIPVGVSVTVTPPTYLTVQTNVQYELVPGYTHSQVISALRYAIIYGYGYNFLDFNITILPEQIEASLSSIPGVLNAKVAQLYTGTSSGRNTLAVTGGQYLVFADATTNVYPIASLSGIAISGATFSPTFTSSVFSYTVTGVTTTSTLISPTAWDSSCVISVNGSTVSSGSSISITTPSGSTTTVTIVVTTQVTSSDSRALSNTYTLSIVR